MRRIALALLVLAMAVGLGGGLFYTWVLDPVQVGHSAPDTLRSRDKLVYLALIGDLYAHEEDLGRAQTRMADLAIEADGPTLARLIEQHLDGGARPEDIRNLARLAEALGARGGVLSVFAPPPTLSPQQTATSPPQPGLTPTTAPIVTPAPRFHLVEQTATCAEPGRAGQIAAWVNDSEGKGLAGIEIVVSWASGQDRFFTGLRPDIGPGYADFVMSPGIQYEVMLAALEGDVVRDVTSDLEPGTCPTGTTALDWRLVFAQDQ